MNRSEKKNRIWYYIKMILGVLSHFVTPLFSEAMGALELVENKEDASV